jgi:hypothetical protein
MIRPTAVGWAVSTRDGQRLLATINGRRKSLGDPREVHVTDGPVYRAAKTRWGWLSYEFHAWYSRRLFVDADSGEPAIKVVGFHFKRSADGTVQVLSQADAIDVGPRIWRFPVQATNDENAVMTAVDDLGNTVMRFRRTPALKDWVVHPRRAVGSDAGIDIVLSPGLQPSPELLLIASVASHWMITYFNTGIQ